VQPEAAEAVPRVRKEKALTESVAAMIDPARRVRGHAERVVLSRAVVTVFPGARPQELAVGSEASGQVEVPARVGVHGVGVVVVAGIVRIDDLFPVEGSGHGVIAKQERVAVTSFVAGMEPGAPQEIYFPSGARPSPTEGPDWPRSSPPLPSARR